MVSPPATDHYRPYYELNAGPPAAPPAVKKAMYEFQGNNGRGRPSRSGEFTFRQPPRPRISDRPLLTKMRAPSPDPVFKGVDTVDKFRQIDDLTGSEEEDMDVSPSGDDEEHHPSKRLQSGPSWSNPDPYTALPPVAETQRKKQDVVKLIRRSRVSPPPAESTSVTVLNGEDFIAFDMGDVTQEDNAEERSKPPANAPLGPKSQAPEDPTQLGKRKRDPHDEVSKLPPRANRGSRLHQNGKILRDWRALDMGASTPWYRPPSATDVLAGVA